MDSNTLFPSQKTRPDFSACAAQFHTEPFTQRSAAVQHFAAVSIAEVQRTPMTGRGAKRIKMQCGADGGWRGNCHSLHRQTRMEENGFLRNPQRHEGWHKRQRTIHCWRLHRRDGKTLKILWSIADAKLVVEVVNIAVVDSTWMNKVTQDMVCLWCVHSLLA